ncbi:MAG: DVU0298 family protein [Desulfobacteria bacterium]
MLKKSTGRTALKRKVLSLLKLSDFDQALDELSKLPTHRVINPLITSLCTDDEEMKWRAVTAMGFIVSNVAEKDMEAARTVMRSLMWSLNDESGGIGWGAPEAMGEIMACNKGLAEEFAHILLSYIREDGNYIDYQPLQRGVVWGLGRLAQMRPDILREKDATRILCPCLGSSDTTVRALAAWAVGLLGVEDGRSQLEALLTDNAEVHLYRDRYLGVRRISEMAREALEADEVIASKSLIIRRQGTTFKKR